MDSKAFRSGFEKRALEILPTGELAKQVQAGTLSPHEMQTLSYHLRNRDLGRLLRGALFTGGGYGVGALLGAGAGSLAGRDFSFKGVPSVAGGVLGGVLGRMLEASLLDPEDRLFYAHPEAAIERLLSAKIPYVVNPVQPSDGALELTKKLDILPGL